MHVSDRLRRESQCLREPVINEQSRIRGTHTCVAGQPGQHRVGLRQRVPAETELASSRPGVHGPMGLVGGDEQRDGDARVDREPRPIRHRRPVSMSANIVSSVTH